MAVLELFAGAAGAFVVAAYFLTSFALALRGRGCTGLAGCIEFARLFLLELALEGIDGGRRSALGNDGGCGLRGCTEAAGRLWLCGLSDHRLGLGSLLSLNLLGLFELLGGLDGLAVGADDLHAEEVAGGVFLEAEHHGFEHVEGLFLVGDERVLLGVAAQADAFLEVVHGEEVVFPEAVEDGEHDDALVVAHLRGGEDLLP